MNTVLSPLRNKPLKKAALIFIALVAARVAAEFGIGVVDGFMAVWTDRA
jgi:hypothetical protein